MLMSCHHHQLSRRLNTVNPNDLLAKRVVDIARHNSSGEAFIKAASSFGKFDTDFLLSLHSQILAHLAAASKTSGNGQRRTSISEGGKAHAGNDMNPSEDAGSQHTGDVQPAAPRQRGGLVRTGDHTFKAPNDKPRASLLGLDRLAAEKRAAAESANASGSSDSHSSKRQRLDRSDQAGQDDGSSGGVFKVPSVPVNKGHLRQKVPETPTHTGGISSTAREALANRIKSRNLPTNLAVGGSLALSADTRDRRDESSAPKGLGDFQRRGNRGLNREQDRYDQRRGDRRGADDDRRRDGSAPGRSRAWEDQSTPRTERAERFMDGGSLRVPNRGWDETPRTGSHSKANDAVIPRRGWDAPTPRRRPGDNGYDSPLGDATDGGINVDAKEWEEEQVRLDRDWYNTYDEGAVAGDEEHNPFAGYEDMTREQEAQIQAKQEKRLTARQAQWVGCISRTTLTEADVSIIVFRTPILMHGKTIEC